jgi:nucleoside-diphosphate-sugar epimerase
MNRILTTGATGFIGRHFLLAVLAAGISASAVHRLPAPPKRAFVQQMQSRGVSFHQGDIRHKASLRPAMKGVDCVCHFASAFRESGMPDEYFRKVNVDGTRNVIEAAAEQGVRRFVYCSTAGIYGSRVPGVIDESAPVNPANVYERSKVAAEAAVRKYTSRHGMEYAIFRPAVVYGPHDERLLKMFRSASKGRFPLFGSGKGRRHMVYVGDVADAALRACTLPEAAGQEMIIAGPRAAQLREILGVLAHTAGRPHSGLHLPLTPMKLIAAVTEDACKIIGVQPPIYRRRMDFYLNDAAFDCTRAQTVLDWRPTVDLDEGFARTLASYRKSGMI